MLSRTLRDAAAVDDLRVVGMCDCGCPTIHFTAGPNAHTIAEAHVADSNDTLLLFVDAADELSSLELAWVSDEPPDELPPSSSVRPSAAQQ